MDLRRRIKNQNKEEFKTENQNNNRASSKWPLFWLFILFFSILLAIVFILVPVFFYMSATLRQHVLFMNYVNFSPKVNYSNPEKLGLYCCKNFYLPSENNSVLGIWHILPGSLKDHKCGISSNPAEFGDSRPVILYLHGSGGNRGSRHRVAMYKVLTESIIDAHVVTLDYRGFGDSTSSYISVHTIVTDAEVVYRWLLNNAKTNKIYIWGHSMGSAAALKLASTRPNIHPVGLVMEGPFASSEAALRDYPLSILYRHMPFFDHFFLRPIQNEDTNFDSTAVIGNVTFPVLILHAKDDSQIPYYQGELLYKIAVRNGNERVKFIGYDESLGYDHLHIGRDPDLPNKVLSFMKFADQYVR